MFRQKKKMDKPKDKSTLKSPRPKANMNYDVVSPRDTRLVLVPFILLAFKLKGEHLDGWPKLDIITTHVLQHVELMKQLTTT